MSEEVGAIVPAEQRTISFYGDELVAVRDEAGTVWVPIRRLCEAIGISRQGQLRRIRDDPVMSRHLRSGNILLPDGRTFSMECLPVKWVRFWLATLNAKSAKEAIRPKIIQYQEEVADIIDRAFARAPITPAAIDEAHMVAMRDLARQQAELWDAMIVERRRLDAVQELAEDHEGMIRDLEQSIEGLRRELALVQAELNKRLTAVSNQIRLLPAPRETRLTPEQKATIRGLVEDLVAAADARGVKLWQGKNNYQSAYATLNRTFGVAKYEELTAAQYPKAVEWLKREIAKLETSGGRS